jgi:hypothetical protein
MKEKLLFFPFSVLYLELIDYHIVYLGAQKVKIIIIIIFMNIEKKNPPIKSRINSVEPA